MDKEFIKEFANKYYITNQVPSEDIDYLLSSYCEEFNKDSYKTLILISLLKEMGIINQYIQTALDYYIRKYSISLLLSNQQGVIKIL